MSAQQIPGPFSIHVTSKEHIVRGRHGAIIRRYPNAAKEAAMEDLRRLQKGYTVEQKRIRDAAPDMLKALEDLVNSFEKHRPKAYWDAARAAIAKARGEVA